MSKNMAGKWVLLVIAFIVSCLIWYMVITSDDPRVNISLGNIEVQLLNEDQLHEKGLAYYVEENSAIEMKVNVVQERGWLVKAEDIQLTADLADVSGEKCVIPVTAQVLNNQTIIGTNYKLSANSIVVRTEELQEKEVPVIIHTEGEPEDDCSIGTSIPGKDSVKIQIPESIYDQVVFCGATVDISGRSADYEGEEELSFYDKDGKAVDCQEQQILPETTKISVKIPIGITKKVKIQELSSVGSCSEGYRCTGIEAEKSSVMVLGPEEVVEDMTSISIPADRINLDGKSESFKQNINLSEFLPEGVIVYDPEEEELQVSVTIEKLETKTFLIPFSNIKYKNLSVSLKAVIRSTQVEMMIQGLVDELDMLEPDQIQLMLDLSGLKEGTHRVRAEYSFKDTDVEYKVISLEKVTVVISES